MPASLRVRRQLSLEDRVRTFTYRYFLTKGRAPTLAEMAAQLSHSLPDVRKALQCLAQTHAFVAQENGELWRAAPFSAIPTPFPVEVGRHFWYANCIWDALGIPAMLHKDGRILASCGCCNYTMTLTVKNRSLQQSKGIIHIAVPARQWYDDIVFT
jgi:Alkylmercury lyase